MDFILRMPSELLVIVFFLVAICVQEAVSCVVDWLTEPIE